MKKVFIILLTIFCLSIFSPHALAVEGQLDQYCQSHNGYTLLNGKMATQGFILGKDYIDKIGIYIAGTGTFYFEFGTGNYNLILSKKLDVYLPGPGLTSKWVYIPFNPMNLGSGTKALFRVTGIGDTKMYQHNGSMSHIDCYPAGEGFINSNPMVPGTDWLFRSYGYSIATDNPPAEGSVTPKEGETTPETTEPGTTAPGPETQEGLTGAAPSATPDTSIQSPTQVKVENEKINNKSAVKISWQKSGTADITGYKIFRKSEGSQYGQVGLAGKDTTSFDDKVVTQNAKYTYMVRSCRNNKESPNSNEVTITTEDNKVAAPTSEPYYFWEDPWIISLLSFSLLAIIILIILYIISRKKNLK